MKMIVVGCLEWRCELVHHTQDTPHQSSRGRPNHDVRVVGLFEERIEWHRPSVAGSSGMK